MTARPSRTPLPHESDPVHHELTPFSVQDLPVSLWVTIRHAPDGAWRARLRFVTPESPDRETAEIFCADSEPELWRAVRTLGRHHLRALYLSLV